MASETWIVVCSTFFILCLILFYSVDLLVIFLIAFIVHSRILPQNLKRIKVVNSDEKNDSLI